MKGWALPRAIPASINLPERADDTRSNLPVVLIPAYKPCLALPDIARELAAAECVQMVVVVNDGSGPGYTDLFDRLANLENVYLLHHAINFGKGAALKTGLNFVLCAFPKAVGVITADADGQHSTKDILRFSRFLSENPGEFAIGTRAISRNIPLRSFLGNSITNFVFGCLTGKCLKDTQSGLRALPVWMIPELLKLDGVRYEFETNMLFYAAGSTDIRELSIETIYLENNQSSHFHPIADSAKIYYKLVQFYASSALAALLDLVVFGIAIHFTGNLLFSFLVGRVLIAALVNFNLNRRFVFNNRGSALQSLAKYYLSFAVFACISYFSIRALTTGGLEPVLAKTLVESVLSILSFAVQGIYVFAERKLVDN